MKLEEIRKLCAAATPGPWHHPVDEVDRDPETVTLSPGYWWSWSHRPNPQLDGQVEKRCLADAAFIAAARELVPKLLTVAELAKRLVETPASILVRDPVTPKLRDALAELHQSEDK